MIEINSSDNAKLINLETRFSPEWGCYMADIHYRLENDKEIKELYLKDVHLPFPMKALPVLECKTNYLCLPNYSIIVSDDLEIGDISMERIKKEKEYTMQELEDILGCKVKIVKEK